MRKGLSRDAVKYIAAAAMTCNHIAQIFLLPGTLLYTVFVDIGYFTAITMCYFLVEGYGHTSDIKKYVKRLFVFALISQLPFYFAFHATVLDGRVMILNMLFSLLLSLLILILLDSTLPDRQKKLLILLCYFVSCFCDWPGLAVGFTLLFREMKKKERGVEKAYLIAAGVYALIAGIGGMETAENPVQALTAGVLSSLGLLASGLVITRLYNGKKGKYPVFSKWFFYVYYPAHLMILTGIRQLMLAP